MFIILSIHMSSVVFKQAKKSKTFPKKVFKKSFPLVYNYLDITRDTDSNTDMSSAKFNQVLLAHF